VEHDCLITAGHLRQALSQDKRPISLFLGAGCPMAISIEQNKSKKPLIPDIAGMTSLVFAELSKSPLKDALAAVLKHFEVDAKPSPNTEEFLSHIRLLSQVAARNRLGA
jgi:hypothetical protein